MQKIAVNKKATYNYVLNYNTDDFLFSNALSTYVSLTIEHPRVDLFYTSYFINGLSVSRVEPV